MKVKLKFLYPSLLLITASACLPEESLPKELGPFEAISANGGVSFKLVQGVENRVLSTTLNEASYNVNNNQLTINATSGSMTIAIHNLDQLWCNACKVTNSGSLIMDTLGFTVHAGSIELNDLQINDILKVSAINTGTYEFSGTATFLDLSIVNSTYFKGYELVTDSIHVNSQNAVDAEVHATEILDATIQSSGDINYKGDPLIVRVSGVGTGQVVKK